MHVWSVLTGLWVLNIDVVVAAMVVMMKRFMIRGGENFPNWNFFIHLNPGAVITQFCSLISGDFNLHHFDSIYRSQRNH